MADGSYIPRFRRALELDPNFALARCDLAWAYLAKGDPQSAIAELEQIVPVNDSSAILSTLASAYGDAGRRADAQRILDRLTQRASERHVSPFFFATIYISLKQYDEALSALEQGYANRDWVMVWTHVTVRMDPLRSNPQFKELLRKMNLQEYHPDAI